MPANTSAFDPQYLEDSMVPGRGGGNSTRARDWRKKTLDESKKPRSK